jgi:MoxR-like ATPase
VDRFMLKVKIDYPNKKEELEIIERMAKIGEKYSASPVVSPEEILSLRKIVNDIYIDEKIKNYILDIVFATREPKAFGLDLENYIEYGASPRASIALVIASKAHAFIRGRGYVTPQDVKSIGMDVLRHRVIPTYEAEAEEMTSEDILKKIFDEIEVP